MQGNEKAPVVTATGAKRCHIVCGTNVTPQVCLFQLSRANNNPINIAVKLQATIAVKRIVDRPRRHYDRSIV